MKKFLSIFILIIPVILSAEFPDFDLREITQPDHGNPGVFSGDINNDGMMDIVATESDPEAVKWYQNVGLDEFWNEMLIAYVPGLYLCTAHMNDDDFIDVLVTCSDNRVLLFINPGNNQTDWEEIEIAINFTNPHGIDTGDIDGDGDLDVLATSHGLGKICWFENDNANWNEHMVSDTMPQSQSGCLYNLDNDDDIDIIGASSSANDICVWLNDGEPEVGLTQYTVEDSFQLAHWVSVKDLNGDNLPDIMGASYIDDEISWWENNGDLPDTWSKHIISTIVNGALTVESEDMDNDGDNDVVATAWISDDIYVWENLDGSALNWTRHTISGNTNGAWSLHIAKLDNDDDFDVICGSDPLSATQAAAPLSWWENDLDPLSANHMIIHNETEISNYPNPFNPSTTISFSVTQSPSIVELSVYNIKGQKVKTLVNTQLASGNYNISWDGKDGNNKHVSTGEYFAKLKIDGEEVEVQKMLLLK